MEENALNIFTDGSSLQNPRRGGTGFRFAVFKENYDIETEDFPGIPYVGATNNQMELQACILALKEVLRREDMYKQYNQIVIHSDSLYVIQNIHYATYAWSQQDWRNRDGKPVANADLWKELVKCIHKIYQQLHKKVTFKKVKAHSTNEHNNAVDRVAKKAAKARGTNRVTTKRVRRKKFKESKLELGSVKMLGQKLSIFVCEEEHMKLANTGKFRYQVTSKNSPFYKKTDFIYSDLPLSSGHEYFVRVNQNDKYPQVMKIFKELNKKEGRPKAQ